MANAQIVDWSTIPLGQKPDAEIAREYGLNASSVGGARRRLGIPPFVGTKKHSGKPKNIDWDNEDRLGKMTDVALARELGVDHTSVWKARHRRGIPSFSARGRRSNKKKVRK